MNSRAIAASSLHKVLRNACTLDVALDDAFVRLDDDLESAFVQELCYGVMRWYPRLQFIADELLLKPLKQKDGDINCLILLGIYQMDFMRTPEHAAVAATVDACKPLHKPWAKSLVNALLRRYQREKPLLQERVAGLRCAYFAHPEWMIDLVRRDWPGQWQDLLGKNNAYPDMHLRVNLQSRSRAAYLDELAQTGIAATALPLANCAVKLEVPVAVEKLPGFYLGHVSVQDLGAQLAVSLLSVSPGMRVLDACAAPGGKASHIYECEPLLGELVAVDRDAQRTALLKNTQQRLGTKMKIVEADAGDIDRWWDGQAFDRILLDGPCSASGVIRRHPDIKMLRQAAQLPLLMERQAALLNGLWPLLKEGGKMLYSTCSIFREENDMQIEKHLARHNDAVLHTINTAWGIATEYGRQTLPTMDETDGFYYALLGKKLAP